MPSKLMSLSQAVTLFTRDGMQYASGAGLPVGADSVVFGRELVRRNRRHLHAIFHCNTQQLNLLCAAGAVDKIECGFSGLEGFGFANGLRRAVESGRVLLEDYSNLTMALRFLGGALNWPFVPTTVNIGTDLQFHSAFDPDRLASHHKIPPVTDPFSGQDYGALSPLRPDLAVIHVTLADPEGNAILLGSEWSRFELSRAARRVILIADHLVATDCMRQFPNLVRIPGLLVAAVVYWPFSAWPQGSPGVHDIDESHMHLMNKAFTTPDGYARYRRDFIDSYQTLDEYLALIGPDTVEKLAATATAFLLDPYRRWLLSRADVDELLAENLNA